MPRHMSHQRMTRPWSPFLYALGFCSRLTLILCRQREAANCTGRCAAACGARTRVLRAARADGWQTGLGPCSIGGEAAVLALITAGHHFAAPTAQFPDHIGHATSASLVAQRLRRGSDAPVRPVDARPPLSAFMVPLAPDARFLLKAKILAQMLRTDHATGARLALVMHGCLDKTVDFGKMAAACYLFDVFTLIADPE